jgi:hypothetical protein
MTRHLKIHVSKDKKELYMQEINLKELVANVAKSDEKQMNVGQVVIVLRVNHQAQSLQRQILLQVIPLLIHIKEEVLNSFTGTCTYCHKVGYCEAQCFSKIREQRDAATTAMDSGTTPTTSNQ